MSGDSASAQPESATGGRKRKSDNMSQDETHHPDRSSFRDGIGREGVTVKQTHWSASNVNWEGERENAEGACMGLEAVDAGEYGKERWDREEGKGGVEEGAEIPNVREVREPGGKAGEAGECGVYGEDDEAWKKWEEEMRQYGDWESGKGGGVGSSLVVGPGVLMMEDMTHACNELTSILLEDAEARVAVLHILSESGLSAERVQELFLGLRCKLVTPSGHTGAVVLLGQPTRDLHVRHFGWARFTSADVDFVARFSPLVEMGAGSGWLAYLLKEKGADVCAYDSKDGETFVDGWEVWPWSACVQKGSEEVLNHSGNLSRTLLICWPDLDKKFATACVREFPGSVLIYIGEGRGGSTAEESFFQVLEEGWKLEESKELQRFPDSDVDDHIFVYRKEQHSTP